MRKADYLHLARLIRDELEQIRRESDSSTGTDQGEFTRAADRIVRLARRFADRASVDRAQFLGACGIASE